MTAPTREPLGLLTVQEVARILHVSDDTVRRQIREGDLPAVRIGTTPQGRARLRVSSETLDRRLKELHGGAAAAQTPRLESLEQFRALFAHMSDEERETLFVEALEWARGGQSVSMVGRRPQPSPEQLRGLRASRLKDLPEATD